MRLLPRVDAAVQVQVLLVCQSLATDITDVHVLTCVRLHVQRQRVAVRKDLAAGGALVDLGRRLGVRVDRLLVRSQVARVGE